jgi:hypothetical protein
MQLTQSAAAQGIAPGTVHRGTGAATMQWLIFVFDKAHSLVKQCGSQPNTPVGGGRFTCKAGGNVSVTLTIKPNQT